MRAGFRTWNGCLGKLSELGLDGAKVGEVAGGVVDLGELDDAIFINEEGGALGNAPHDEVLLGEELIVSDTVSFGDFVIVVGEQLEGDALFLSPRGLCEGIVAGDSENLAVEVGVSTDPRGDLAELSRAHACVGHRDEEEEDVLLAELLGEFDYFRAAFAEADEGKIRGFIANLDTHGGGIIITLFEGPRRK